MSCPTGKTSFDSEELAVEALIQNHVRNAHRSGAGPRNVYECAECGCWHFTSKGADHTLFDDPEIIDRIQKESRALEWERKFR